VVNRKWENLGKGGKSKTVLEGKSFSRSKELDLRNLEDRKNFVSDL